ncbi:hypothetical protein GQ457_12G022220 [Hibiscus cannabinus]
MEKRLRNAAMEGDMKPLHQLLQQDPLLLHRSIVSCASDDTRLHVSSTLGHLRFVQQLLKLNPELASELDSHGCSALHLAAAKGYLGIVRVVADPEKNLRWAQIKIFFMWVRVHSHYHLNPPLVEVDSEMAMVRNQEGRTPLHLAAIKGGVEVVDELSLIELNGEDDEMVNHKDCEGNTLLHVAVAKKQIEIIKFLLTVPGLDVNAMNNNGFTALDTLKQSPRAFGDLEIESILRDAGVLSSKDLHVVAVEWIPNPPKIPRIPNSPVSNKSIKSETDPRKSITKRKHTDWLSRKRSALMVVSSLIATVAYQAAISPPGGVLQADETVDDEGNPLEHPRKAGTAVMAYKQGIEYGQFMIFKTLAFLASLSIILLLVSGLPMKKRRWIHMSPDSASGVLHDVTQASVLAWLGLMGVVFIGNVVRMNLWILRKYRVVKEKKQNHSTDKVDNGNEDV